MKTLMLVVMLAVLVCRLNADRLETNQINFSGKNVKKVVKFQPVTYSYTLNTQLWSIWSEFPGLSITITVPFAQQVYVKYHIINYSNNLCYEVTRLMVDGTENMLFRYISHNVIYHTHIVQDLIWLEKGTHFIAVNYRSECSWSPNIISDWNYAYIRAEYYEETK